MEEARETKTVRRKSDRSAPAYIPHEEQFLLYYDANLKPETEVEQANNKGQSTPSK